MFLYFKKRMLKAFHPFARWQPSMEFWIPGTQSRGQATQMMGKILFLSLHGLNLNQK